MKTPDQLSRFLRDRRRPGPLRRVLFMRQGHFLEEECLRALRALGFCVREFRIGDEGEGSGMSRLFPYLEEFLPDFLFSLNYIGFDHAGQLASLLRDSRLPAATWFVGNPDIIIRAYPENVSEWVAVFAQDQDSVTALEAMGFPWVTHLPLASDTQVFRPYRHPPVGRFGRLEAAFVGSTWDQQVSRHLAAYAKQPALLAYVEAAAQSFQWSPHNQATSDLAEVMPGFAHLPLSEQMNLEAAVVWLASQQDRLARVGALSQAGLKVFGDPSWVSFLPDPTAYCGPLDYHDDLPAFYQCVAVNLNFTGLHLKNGLNQRVFDAPAAGAFVLTDHKEALWGLFSPDEMVTYRTLEEAQEKLAYYLKYPETRRRVATRARERVLSQHTYGHRMQVIERQMTEIFFS
jgi:spore maturation protein CgeB